MLIGPKAGSRRRRCMLGRGRSNEEDAVALQGLSAADRSPDASGRRRHRLRDELLKRRQPHRGRLSVRDGDHEPYRLLLASNESIALELSRPQLRLEIHQGALDLDVNDLGWAYEEQIRGAGVARRDRDLEACLPARMRCRDNCLSQRELTGVAQADRRHRVEAPPELMTARGDKLASNRQRQVADGTLDEADLLLTDSGEPRHLHLRETSAHPCNAQLAPE
jgi:hypothetical protein